MDQPKDPDQFPDLGPTPIADGGSGNNTLLSDGDGGDSSSQYTDASGSDFSGPLDNDDDDGDDGEEEEEEEVKDEDFDELNSRPRNPYNASANSITSPPSSTANLNAFIPPAAPISSPPHFQNSSEALLPPFYNRPPTPVPPSPSFTNLILPTATAPATPYASDDDVAAPISPTSPKVPTYEYYGFVLYLFSSVAFLIYLLWSFLPSPFLHALGIYYYPNRWWSLAIPSFLVMTIVYIYVALVSYNVEVLTPPLHAIETIVDDAAKVAVVDGRGRLVHGKNDGKARRPGTSHGNGGSAGGGGGGGGGVYGYEGMGRVNQQQDTGLEAWCVGTDAVLDIPLAGVCEMLYANRDWSVRNGENGRYAS